MKKNKIIMGLSALLVVTLITTGCGKEIEVKNGSKVAVSVKDEKFTATEYYEEIKENNISTLIDMIDHSILDKKYKSDDAEKNEIDNQIEQIKSYYGDDENTYKSVIQQYFGVEDEKELREKLSLEYKRNKAVEDYIKENIKDDEIKKYYEENVFGQLKASHILISVNVSEDASDEEKEKADKKALETAKKIIKDLNQGKKFKTLAKKYSDDKATATNGGDLGYFNATDMVEEFSNAVKNLKNNEYTKEPVKTQYGYHIILRTGEKDKPTLKEAKDDIKDKIKTQKLNDNKALYYESLMDIRDKNKIKWNDDKLKKSYDKYMNKLIESTKENS
ncbi:MAG: peptidylprolyl isomerase [Bacilli bacterium]|nr:peptidylprolyl isomerase [Bacilli bacterium]